MGHLGEVVATTVGVEQERHDRGVVRRFLHHALRVGRDAVERLQVMTARRDAREGGDGVIQLPRRHESLVGVEHGDASVSIDNDRGRC